VPAGASRRRAAPDWDGVGLHVVTGKGGTGKTTVAAALALALAADGRRTLLIEVEERQGIARLFGLGPLPYAEQLVATVPADDGPDGEVHALAVDAEAALLEYLEMFYNLRGVGRPMRTLGLVDFATTVAPGLRDVLLTGKAAEATRRKDRSPSKDRNAKHQPGYDAVVLDAPPTGRVGRFLNANSEVMGLAKVGPVNHHAESVMAVLRSPATVVHLVTLLEEMPVQETLDAAAELRGLGFEVGGVVINAVRRSPLRPTELRAVASGDVDVSALAAELGAAGVPDAARTATALLDAAAEQNARAGVERSERRRLREIDHPHYELPRLPGPVDLEGLRRLAAALRKQGMA
jgi:cellulose biosynthesis protein BcsQ